MPVWIRSSGRKLAGFGYRNFSTSTRRWNEGPTGPTGGVLRGSDALFWACCVVCTLGLSTLDLERRLLFSPTAHKPELGPHSSAYLTFSYFLFWGCSTKKQRAQMSISKNWVRVRVVPPRPLKVTRFGHGSFKHASSRFHLSFQPRFFYISVIRT